MQAAQRVLEATRRVLDGLERVAVAGVQRVLGLARGLGTQIVGEHKQWAWEAERERRQQQERHEATRRAEQDGTKGRAGADRGRAAAA